MGADWTNRQPIAAGDAPHVVIVRIEVEVPRGLRIVHNVRAERTRPVAAIGTNTIGTIIRAAASSRQEDGVAIGAAGDQHPIYTIQRSPSSITIIYQFIHFVLCWHSPACAPVGYGSIIYGFQSSECVGKTLVAVV